MGEIMPLTEVTDAIENKIASSGYKLTYSRLTMIKFFVDSREHLKPEDVYHSLKEYGISLPTVYRNISIFKQLGIVKEVVIQDDHYYELDMYSQKKLHIHFRCKLCGQIKEYADRKIFKDMIQQKEVIENAFQDEIEDITIVMTGTCKQCKENSVCDFGGKKK